MLLVVHRRLGRFAQSWTQRLAKAVRAVLRRGSIQGRIWHLVWWSLSAAATLTSLWLFYVEVIAKPKPQRMVGDLNVAVAEFTATD